MKKLITVLFVCFGLASYGQTTINPDTVCANAVGEQYFVTNTPTSTYNWTITGGGGALQTGQGTNSITVDWGGVTGLYPNAVEVIESNAAGCPGAPILLDVFVLLLSGRTGVAANAFQPSVGVGNYVLTYTMAGCNTTINVTVNNGPVTGPIQHF